jgi:GNAT superfamily N-acetyltransferase
MDIACREIHPSDTIALRHAVLYPHLPPEAVKLPEDERGRHFGAFIDGAPLPTAVISLFAELLPLATVASPLEQPPQEAVRFRKFACAVKEQGRGIGSILLNHAMSIARSEMGAHVLWCDARLETADWYGRKGMETFGQTFWKNRIEYVRMKILLRE